MTAEGPQGAVYRAGKGGEWLVGHTVDRVVLEFTPEGHSRAIFKMQLMPDVAVQLAQQFVKHAMGAGHGEPVTLTIGTP